MITFYARQLSLKERMSAMGMQLMRKQQEQELEANSNTSKPKSSKSKQIREYMLSQDSFSLGELAEEFPEISYDLIKNETSRSKKKGLISQDKAKGRGHYTVNKNVILELSESRQIREYMLSRDLFSLRELVENFPEISYDLIRNEVLRSKKKGLISQDKAKGKGHYIVKK